MSTGASDANASEGGRLGGARADFVASLGRKVSDTRGLLSVLEDDPSSKLARDELRRRLHALFSSSRILRFDGIVHALQGALAVLDSAAQRGELGETEIVSIAKVLDDLPSLAWGDATTGVHPRPSSPASSPAAMLPITVLVIGEEALSRALLDSAGAPGRTFECERTGEVRGALELARAYAPDLTVVDADLDGAMGLVSALLTDPLTEATPLVVTGSFPSTEETSRLASLGVFSCLPKPVAAAVLRASCHEVADAHEGRTIRMTLGEPTLEQLADRLSNELKRALVNTVERPKRSVRIPLGEGTEVLGALWGAIARVQEVVSQRTGGAIRFEGEAPEGAVALAPWMHQDPPGAGRMVGRGRGAAADVRLKGRRVVVADDDPGVTWFISDLLRTAGCEVFEALDGKAALDLAYRMQPELVVSDILMPELDGFALSRALRRDVALRDTPVILLSWKEDLLQRVRELGANAAAYMRKESDSRAILARVREVLRPRARVETRMRESGEVRGRLDDLSPRLLLELVCVVRRDARVAVRDASFLYEIDVRGGAPRKATRTASDGGYQSGERALASLLGVGAGRFVISPMTDHVRGDLAGTLFEQLARPIASARGALAATTGTALMKVERVGLDRATFDETVRATPQPARALIRLLEGGASPRQMLLGGEVSPSLLEDVLSDLAARGAIRSVDGDGGADLLGPAVEAALTVVRGTSSRSHSQLPPSARLRSPAVEAGLKAPSPPYETLHLSEPPAPPLERDEEDGGAPSSLADAVMREISDRSPQPGPARASGPALPPIIEPSELRPRSSNPPAGEAEGPALAAPVSSIPPDAVVPAELHEVEPAPRTPASIAEPSSTFVPAPPGGVRHLDEASAPSPEAAPSSRASAKFPWGLSLAFFALLGIVAAVLRPAAPTSSRSTEPASGASAPIPKTTAASRLDDDPPVGVAIPPGAGALEVTAPAGAQVRVDGAPFGHGPTATGALPAGYHEVVVEQAGPNGKQVIEVRAGKTTRVRAAAAP